MAAIQRMQHPECGSITTARRLQQTKQTKQTQLDLGAYQPKQQQLPTGCMQQSLQQSTGSSRQARQIKSQKLQATQ
jgi:hypothetical protein